jgi:hypothetical protein
VDNSGGWTNYSDPWNSVLKLHASGYLYYSICQRGSDGHYWSSTQYSYSTDYGRYLHFSSRYSSISNYGNKADGFGTRCLRDTCWSLTSPPAAQTAATGASVVIWKWFPVTGAAGYRLGATNNFAAASDLGTATSLIEDSLNCVTTYTRYVWAYNSCGIPCPQPLIITATTADCCPAVTVNHTAGEVAPVSKAVTYGTVTGIPGEWFKCWITQNLGSDRQALAKDDNSEASAGWYWQFNRKQGYKHDGSTLTPAWTITGISENSDWLTANDPCNLELGTPWRLPTYTEWYNVNNTGGWTNWNGPWNSDLKLHSAGFLDYSSGSLFIRGWYGYYWSSTQNSTDYGWKLVFGNSFSYMGGVTKAYGYSVRCLRD